MSHLTLVAEHEKLNATGGGNLDSSDVVGGPQLIENVITIGSGIGVTSVEKTVIN
jgi:hypothetical protein